MSPRDVDLVLDGVGGDDTGALLGRPQARRHAGVHSRHDPSEQKAAARGVRTGYVSVHADGEQLRAIADLAEARTGCRVHVDATFPH